MQEGIDIGGGVFRREIASWENFEAVIDRPGDLTDAELQMLRRGGFEGSLGSLVEGLRADAALVVREKLVGSE